MLYSQESFNEQFKWDSIFQPTYEIVVLEDQNDQIIATVASSSKHYKFLKNDPLTCRFRISFNANQITKLESLECLDANWGVWQMVDIPDRMLRNIQMERDSLVNWTNRNYPVFDGFIHDLTMNGAIKYLQAIELYENRKDAL
ncbi:hypothetical protein U3A58_20755 [Algoriphagus sp. C2-6-M1]|uniref:hypothetical protein n=1 Tax=Algoriphagus persicinus TaxID=3108754 RepID=UPI002B369AA9|nr:hypothetical protein [Algoriphagus sp. C2-6-M1]MEB2782824.1 hypothetical protein [Algoriphagus sp. C2-6-M1]